MLRSYGGLLFFLNFLYFFKFLAWTSFPQKSGLWTSLRPLEFAECGSAFLDAQEGLWCVLLVVTLRPLVHDKHALMNVQL